MEWTEFLAEIADAHLLSPEQTEAFLIRLQEGNRGKSEAKLASELNISAYAFKKRMSGVYEQFAQSCPELAASDNRGKLKKLRAYLRTKYSERSHKPLTHPNVSNVGTIQPIQEGINWREVCGKVLARQREEQQLRRKATERGFELNVYVPLGLVERKQQQRRRGDVLREQVYQLTEEVITKEYDNNQFLTEVIDPGKSRRIAIIGEPGAGKTTLQEKIAVWIHDNNKGLPICIPLGGLQGKSLEDYLLQIWLKAALRFIEPDALGVEARHLVSLQQQFREGKVWLLLDGVDEMATTSPVEALATIKAQLTDWLVEARVVLTCRLNVWDANVTNMLTGFETYRTLEFKPQQVEDFIRQWFAEAGKADPPQPPLLRGEDKEELLFSGEQEQEKVASVPPLSKGEELLRKLQQPGKERIRELVRNPLRLSLLCQTSYVLPVDEPLPETKAALYERFTRYFYEWKQEQHPTTRTERRQLNQALGELAKAGIDSTTRFRLGEDLACDVMGESLFDLACRLGLLNLVDREAKTDEAVYAFFHPTFQEYFAACAIDDWRYFLNHDNENPNPLLNPNSSLEYDDGKPTYRIFELRWKEVFLLWMGRDSTELPNEFKEQFIQALIEFNDGIDPFFYKHRAFFLATAAMAELANFHWGDAIVAHLVKGGFGHFSTKEQKWVTFFEPIAEAARLALQETEPIKAVDALVNLIQNCNDKNIQWKAIYSLGQVGRGNPMAVKAIVEFIQQSQDENTRHSAAQILGRIDKGNLIAADTLIKLIGNSQERATRQWAADSLAEIGVGNQITVDALVELTGKSHDEDVRRLAAYCLGKIDKDNPTAIATLKDISLESQDEDICWRTVECIGKIGEGNRKAVDALVEVTRKYQDGFVRWLAAKSLWKIDKGSEIAITAFIDLIRNSQDKITQSEAAKSLGEIGKGNPKAVTTLAELIENSQNEFTRSQVAYCLGQVNNGNPTAINALEGLIRKSEDEEIRRIAAVHLGQVDNGNPTAIDALEGLIRKFEDEEIRRIAAVHLGQADKGKSKAIPALEDLSLNSKNDYIRNKAAHNLEQIDKGNPTAIAALIDLIQNPQHEETVLLPILSLEIIGAGNSTAITALVELIRNSQHGSIRRHAIDCLKRICAEVQMAEVVTLLKDYLSYQTYENDFQRFSDCYEVIWHCAQNIPYPSFYQAWHQTTIHQRG